MARPTLPSRHTEADSLSGMYERDDGDWMSAQKVLAYTKALNEWIVWYALPRSVLAAELILDPDELEEVRIHLRRILGEVQ